jgi:hypothetical protein
VVDGRKDGREGTLTTSGDEVRTVRKHLFDGRVDRERRLLGGGSYAETVFGYDAVSRLNRIEYPDGAFSLHSRVDLTFDENANTTVESAVDYDGVSGTTKTDVTRREYDVLDRERRLLVEGESNVEAHCTRTPRPCE